MATQAHYATGRRKTATARVWISAGNGTVTINDSTAEEYFGGIFFETKLEKPFSVTDTKGSFDVKATIKGGGKLGQLDALIHGISRALQDADPERRIPLKRAGLLTRDSRAKERKKYGQRGARARFQFSKR